MDDVLTRLVDSALTCLLRKSHAEAVGYLRKAEEVLEDSATYGVGSFELVIFVLHNLAYSFQQLGETAETASYLDGCVYNLSTRLKSKPPLPLRIRLEVQFIQTSLQLACVLVSLSKTDIAAKHCEIALKHLSWLGKTYQRISHNPSSVHSKTPMLPLFWSSVSLVSERLVHLLDLKRDPVVVRKKRGNQLIRPCSWADLVLLKMLPLDFWKVNGDLVSMDSLCLVISLSAAVLYLYATMRQSLGLRDAKVYHRRAVLILKEVSENALSSLITKAYKSTYTLLDVSAESAKPRANSKSPHRSNSKAPPLVMKRARSLAPGTRTETVGFNSMHSEAGRRTQKSTPALA